jgi:hypothetical protein
VNITNTISDEKPNVETPKKVTNERETLRYSILKAFDSYKLPPKEV